VVSLPRGRPNDTPFYLRRAVADKVIIPLPGIGTLQLPREVYEVHLRPVAAPQSTAAVCRWQSDIPQ